MLKTEGIDPTIALRAAGHHAEALLPLALEVVVQLQFSPLGQDDFPHLLKQSKGGPNSYGLYLADGTGREFHFRGQVNGDGVYDRIAVYDRWTYRVDGVEPMAVLRTKRDVWRAVGRLRANALTARARGLVAMA